MPHERELEKRTRYPKPRQPIPWHIVLERRRKKKKKPKNTPGGWRTGTIPSPDVVARRAEANHKASLRRKTRRP